MRSPTLLSRLVPALGWGRAYRRADLGHDLSAGVITAALLIPQGLAYALLAGLPPQVGLYASIIPPAIYALLGTSRTLAVGPVSVAALLVAEALRGTGLEPGSQAWLDQALMLAALSGALLLLMGALRLGRLVDFLSHPVLSGFTSAAAVLIIFSQAGALLGIPAPKAGLFWQQAPALLASLPLWHPATTALGLGGVALLAFLRAGFPALLRRLGLAAATAGLLSRAAPLALVFASIALVAALGLAEKGVAVVGAIPAGLPSASLAFLSSGISGSLLGSALLIALIAYVESISVAKVLAYRRRERVAANQELLALGAANAAAAVSGAMPVAGGFSRSMVNYAAGARTQLATLITTALVLLATLFFTPAFERLPKSVLAAVIVVAVAPLVDWRALRSAWRYDRADGATWLVTFLISLAWNLEAGLISGALLSLAVFQARASRPHLAVVGRVPGTEHYRNVCRHTVETWPELLLLRVDRSLYFANSGHLEDVVARAAAEQPALRDLVLICCAINSIDHSALAALERLSLSLEEAGITLHLAEVKGPVMDRLRHSELLEALAPGRIFLSTEAAVRQLRGRP
ncbi:SulP family inorganic anion transporter [Alkalilimnicola sp. S0819]|uniref:SulP family inorganic anion transporter n=1 Tax=Alkalilimnicola sp. S0819 TaxID=2613922 RepID=UPI001261C906|nr:sulfate permease [Alkalilimnicola sp. S0819]KAB7628149.1 sulfate permease [Alkalilimnicola sp. S0819]MPQ15035.1 sulfate permease [Alkalilimnicola sp. S0819]